MRLGIDFWKDFDGFWEGKWKQLGINIDENSICFAKSWFWNIFFSSGKTKFFQKIVFRNRHRFFIDFGANLVPFSFPKSIKISPKTDLERHRFFWWILTSILRRLKRVPRQPKTAQDGHPSAKTAPRGSQDGSKMAPSWNQNASKIDAKISQFFAAI